MPLEQWCLSRRTDRPPHAETTKSDPVHAFCCFSAQTRICYPFSYLILHRRRQFPGLFWLHLLLRSLTWFALAFLGGSALVWTMVTFLRPENRLDPPQSA